MDIQFHDDVADRKSAEALLIDMPVGAFLTWRTSDAAFVLTYNSPSTRKASHVAIKRFPDGTFALAEGLDQIRYKSLSELLAMRQYLRPATSSGADGSSAKAATGGSKTLPSNIPLPAVPESELAAHDDDYLDDRKWMRGIAQTVPTPVFYALFAGCGVLAVGAAGYAARLYRQYDAGLAAATVPMVDMARKGVDAASAALFQRLQALDASSDVAAACTSAVSEWRSSIAALAPPLQQRFDEASGSAYLGGLLAAILLCLTAAFALQLTHTGRKRKRYTPTEEEFMSPGFSRREPICTSLQMWWSLAYLSLVGVALGLGALLSSRAWELGSATTAVQYAAQSLSTAFPSDVRSQTGNPNADVAALYLMAAQRGMWGAAGVLSDVPDACLAAVQPLVADLADMPALVHMGPLPGWAAKLLTPILAPQPSFPGGNQPLAIADPIRWPAAIKGWLHESLPAAGGASSAAGRVLTVVMPTQKAVAFATVNNVAAALAVALAMLVLQENILASWLPAVRRFFKDRARRAAQLAGLPVEGAAGSKEAVKAAAQSKKDQ